MNPKDWEVYNASTFCPICKENYTLLNRKIRDHDHWTGKFRGPLCNYCNVNLMRKNTFIPVFFHNLKGYDSHLILGSVDKELINKSSIKIIPNNSEKYISFSYIKWKKLENEKIKLPYEIRFLDSFAFMATSLDELHKNLVQEQMIISKQYYEKDETFDLMTQQKGVYPYKHMDSFSKYNDTIFPSKDEFYNDLAGKECTVSDYEYGKKVYNLMKCKNMGDYTDVYVIDDVLKLADIFENFREMCLIHYKLDPCWYYTAPGLSWDAMLKITDISLQVIKDYDMYMFIEKGIRGGMVKV